MSRRSRQSAPAITLFSFQDIIMSTSGIMIMIVLILCLELVQRTEIQASASPRRVETPPDPATISQLRQEIEQLEKRIDSTSSLVQSASQMTATEMNEQIQNLQTVNQLLSAKRDELRTMLKQQQDLRGERNAQRDLMADLLRQVEAARQDVASLEQQLNDETQETRPVFSLPRGENQSGWIVEITEARIQAAPIGRAEKPVSFTRSKSSLFRSQSPQEAFLEWSRSQSKHVYFFLFVRPDGAEAFDEISDAFNEGRVSYGFDLADPAETLLDPTRGAAE